MESTVFITKVGSEAEKKAALLLFKSIRSFGGDLSRCPIWLFAIDHPDDVQSKSSEFDCQVIRLEVPEYIRQYPFGDKVFACAYAENLLSKDFQSLVWIDAACLILQPPIQYVLDRDTEAAFRPVHLKNIGLGVSEPLDEFWNKVYAITGWQGIQTSVESFVDQQRIHAYFNTHAFAIRLGSGLLTRWLELFEQLLGDSEFQAGACSDSRHRIFLHQAILSALVTATVTSERIRILPPEYNYPYHLHAPIPAERRAKWLNDLVSIAYEDCVLLPSRMQDIGIHEPLKTWLETGQTLPDQGT